jgi:hypothetical protein
MCRSCHALYMNPCYSDYGFKTLFAEAGQSYGSTKERPHEQIEWLRHRKLLEPGVLVMDAGCYQGDFLALMPNTVRKLGVDIDAPAISRGRELHAAAGIDFILGEFESFQYQGLPPDLITMFHVLEHLPRPVNVLKKLRQISGATTQLIIEVPILENGRTNDVVGFLSVQHMTHFSRSSLRNAFSRSGWQIEEWCENETYNGCRVRCVPSVHEPAAEDCGTGDIGLLNSYMQYWHESVLKVESKISDLGTEEKLVIWGSGAHLEYLYQRTSLFALDRKRGVRLVDADPLKRGKTWRGLPIESPMQLSFVDWRASRMLISSYGSQSDIVDAARGLGVPVDRIITLYDVVRRY